MTLVNIFSKKGPKYNEKGKELKQEKIRHNEHLLEFFQMNKRFVDLLSDYQSKKITEAELRQKTIDLLKEAEQASTSEFQRYNKRKYTEIIADKAKQMNKRDQKKFAKKSKLK